MNNACKKKPCHKQQELIDHLSKNNIMDAEAIKEMMPAEIRTKLSGKNSDIIDTAIKLSTLFRNAASVTKKRTKDNNTLTSLEKGLENAKSLHDSLDIVLQDILKEKASLKLTAEHALKQAVTKSGHDPEQHYATPITNLEESYNPGFIIKHIKTDITIDTIYFNQTTRATTQ